MIVEKKVDKNAFLFTLYNVHGVSPTRYNSLKNKGGIACAFYWGPVFCDKHGNDILINREGWDCNKTDSCYTLNNGTKGFEYDPKYKSSLFVNTAGPNEKKILFSFRL